MYCALTWVPRGVAEARLAEDPVPSAAVLAAAAANANGKEVPDPSATTDAMEDDPSSGSDMDEREAEAMADTDEGAEDEDDDNDGEGVEISEVLANDLDSLTFYKSNADDPLLAESARNQKPGQFDPDEEDEMIIRPADALLIAAKSGGDASTLEFHLFDDNPEESEDETEEYVPNTFVHHDLVIPAIPLCAAFNRIETENTTANVVAVGMFTPGIEMWEVGKVNALEPVQSLGGYERVAASSKADAGGNSAGSAGRKKKSKKKRWRLKEGSHSRGVMSLSWNAVQTEYLASGSADQTVKIWDVESAHCACTMKHHVDKVQSVVFHPKHADVLLTGAFDSTVHVVDVRSQKSSVQWNVSSDVESCHWLPRKSGAEELVLVATEEGYLFVFDRRVASSANQMAPPLAKWHAHAGAASACAVSKDIPGMIVTGGEDKRVKVWNIADVTTQNSGTQSCARTLLIDKPSRVGAVFSASLCPLSNNPDVAHGKASPFVLAYGGEKETVAVVDMGIEHKALRNFYKDLVNEGALHAMELRAARGSTAALSSARTTKQRAVTIETDSILHDHDSHEEDESDDEEEEEMAAENAANANVNAEQKENKL